jgi:hypothetical protein
MINVRIEFIANSDSFLLPGCYYGINDTRILLADASLLREYIDEIMEEPKYIFVINTLVPMHSMTNYEGLNNGVLARLEYVQEEERLYLYVLGKAKLYYKHPVIGTKLVPEPFVSENDENDLDISIKEIEFMTLFNDVIDYDEDYRFSVVDRKRESFPLVYDVLNYLNHMIDISNIKPRQSLYEFYDYSFYLNVIELYLSVIENSHISAEGFTNDSLEQLFYTLENMTMDDDEIEYETTKVKALNRYLSMEFFSSITNHVMTVPIDIDIPDNPDITIPDSLLDDIDELFLRILTTPIYDLEKMQELRLKENPLDTIESHIHDDTDIDDDDDDDDFFGSSSLFDDIVPNQDLWKKKELTKEERDTVYFSFLQQDDSTVFNSFKQLKYIPEYVRNTLDKSQMSGNGGDKEKRRLLTLMRLPWTYHTKDRDLTSAKRILDEGHFGLETVKKAILEYITMVKYTKQNKAKIICLYGPPGVGKSSIAKNIAKALGRSFCSLSLGSISSELDLQGINKTYSAASSGGIINGIVSAGSSNPVFLLDEIDKAPRRNNNANITGILMNLLDPNLNSEFVDSFLRIPYDLSNVLFICTANDLSEMAEPLLNRVEIINIPSYTPSEKQRIIKEHIIPKRIESLTLDLDIKFTDPAISLITTQYALDGGMRESSRAIDTIIAQALMLYEQNKQSVLKIGVEQIRQFLGQRNQLRNNYNQPVPGLVNLLSATNRGGSISKLEVSYYPGEGDIIATGNLGKIITESVNVAFGYMRSNAGELSIHRDIFQKNDFHFHFLDNATMKEGPSGGVGISMAVYSLLTNQIIPNNVAFTGEVSLKGKVLPIGGIIHKLSVCEYEHVDTVYMPKANEAEVLRMQEDISNTVTIKFVDNITELIKDLFVLQDQKELER